MPRNGSGVYAQPSNTEAVSGDPVSSSKFNTLVADLVADANAARPVVAGGTGANNAASARANLGLTIGTDVQAYSSHLATYVANPMDVAELGQLQNIGTTTISAVQWGYLGALDGAPWTAGNDGAGSGLDADTLDGVQGSAFAQLSGATFTDTVTINSAGTNIGLALISTDPQSIITMTDDTTGAGANDDIAISRLGDTLSLWSSGAARLTLGSTGEMTLTETPYVNSNQIWHAGNDGAGSGLDADTLDGVQGSSYALVGHAHSISDITSLQTNLDAKLESSAYTAADVLAKLITVDGAGSGLDADTLDGLQASAFAQLSGANIFTQDQSVESTTPKFRLRETDQGTDGKVWDFYSANGGLGFATRTDAGVFGAYALLITRTGTNVDEITLAADLLDFNGAADFSAVPTVAGSAIWHAGNDGAGSGLDADTLDGVQGSEYARRSAQNTFTQHQFLSYGGPALQFVDTDGASDEQRIRWLNDAGNFSLQVLTDAGGFGANAMVVRRTGTTVDEIELNATVLDFNGATDFSAVPTVGGSAIWHAGNDGAGSGLDADTLDGVQGSAFAQLSGATFTDTVTINSAGTNIGLALISTDPQSIITMTDDTTGAGANDDIAISRLGDTLSLWSSGAARLTLGSTGEMTLTETPYVNSNQIWHAGNDGAGSGLDADTLDGVQASAFATLAGSETLSNKTLTAPTVNGGTIQSRIQSSSETNGTLTGASANKQITATGGITLPSGTFAAGDCILIDGGGTNRTITRGSGLTMYVDGSNSATATLDANGVMGVRFRSASVCVLTGDVS